MKTKWLILVLLMTFAVHLSPAQLVYFTNDSGVVVRLNSVVYDGTSRFVAAGSNTTAITSSLAETGWTKTPTNAGLPSASVSIRAATYGNGRFLLGADDSQVYSSPDGLSWTTHGNPFSSGATEVTGLTYNSISGAFVAVGNAGDRIAVSGANTLDTWTDAPVIAFTEYQYRGVTAFGTNGVAACGLRGLIKVYFGGSWEVRRSGGADLLGIAAGAGKIVAVGSGGTILVSLDDGTNWTPSESGTTQNLNAVTYTGSGFIAVGGGGAIDSSADASTWIPQYFTPSTSLRGVAFDQSRGVAVIVGDGGLVLIGSELPTASVSGDTNVCSGGTNTVQAQLGGSSGPWNVTWSSNGVVVATHNGVVGPIDTLTVGPLINNSNAPTTATYTVSELTDASTGSAGTNLTGSAVVTVNPIATVNFVSDRIHCTGENAQEICFSGALTNTTFVWSSTADVGFGTNGTGCVPAYTATNSGPAPVTANVTVTPNANGCTGTPANFQVTVYPIPLPPMSLGDITNFTWKASAPLVVSNLSAGARIDWFDAPEAGRQVRTNSATFFPTNTLAGSYPYYAQAAYYAPAPGTNRCVSPTRTQVNLTIVDPTLSISLVARTNVVVEWFDDLILQAATNLTQPIVWGAVVTTAVPGTTNYYTNTSLSKTRFFRLSNAP